LSPEHLRNVMMMF